jgi:hypothetical protein
MFPYPKPNLYSSFIIYRSSLPHIGAHCLVRNIQLFFLLCKVPIRKFLKKPYVTLPNKKNEVILIHG